MSLLTDIESIIFSKKYYNQEKIDIIKSYFKNETIPLPREIELIIQQSCDIVGIPYNVFFLNCRKNEIVYAKKIYAYLTYPLYKKKEYTSTQLAEFCNKDHSTYLYYLKCIFNKKYDKKLEYYLSLIKID